MVDVIFVQTKHKYFLSAKFGLYWRLSNTACMGCLQMKYTNAPYVITEEEDCRLRNRRETFIRETGTEKTVLITMITSFGLAPGGYSDDIHCQVTMADLFK